MKYEKPPLVEVVIEVKFNTSVGYKELKKFSKKIDDVFLISKEHIDSNLSIIIQSSGTKELLEKQTKGFRLETPRADYILIATPHRFALSVLNPYPGWDKFFEVFIKYWKEFRALTKCRDIVRVACLSVNRVDAPVTGDTLNIDEYLNIGIKTPPNLTLDGYQAVMGISLPDEIRANVITATTVPAIPNCAALMLNVDIFKDSKLPQSDEELIELLEQIHNHKNDLFKSFITEKSESLFVKVQ